MDPKKLCIGQGYDIHKLIPGRKLLLGGVEIPFEKGLDGHSDADVLIHAICDAMLGAANLGDIGKLFPENDQNRNKPGKEILQQVYKIVKAKGITIINIDATVIIETPKLTPYINDITANLAHLLNVERDQISLKAKTKEGLDSVGKGKAIETVAVALFYKY